jgi:hypothetical protein
VAYLEYHIMNFSIMRRPIEWNGSKRGISW